MRAAIVGCNSFILPNVLLPATPSDPQSTASVVHTIVLNRIKRQRPKSNLNASLPPFV